MRIAVLSVATHGYLEHWEKLLRSVETNFFVGHEVDMHVFTNDLAAADRIIAQAGRVRVRPHEVPDWGWPEATLLRFRAISEYATEISADVACWLDADMLVVRPTGSELVPESWQKGMAFVRHPGFWRDDAKGMASNWLSRPQVIPNDLVWLLRNRPALGAWESNTDSAAYVPEVSRTTYICGGTWFGLTDEVLSMSALLAERTDRDLKDDLIATWHDESHLNWFYANTGGSLLSPEYCFEDSYPRLSGMNPRIVAVHKGEAFQQVRAEQR